MKVRIKENAWVARIAASRLKTKQVAIVFGKTIYLYQTSRNEFLGDRNWVCHELQHIKQYEENGFLGFIVKYLIESIRKGYYNNRFEVEARGNENNFSLMKGVEFV